MSEAEKAQALAEQSLAKASEKPGGGGGDGA